MKMSIFDKTNYITDVGIVEQVLSAPPKWCFGQRWLNGANSVRMCFTGCCL